MLKIFEFKTSLHDVGKMTQVVNESSPHCAMAAQACEDGIVEIDREAKDDRLMTQTA